MAEMGELGNIRARCPTCWGAVSTFEWRVGGNACGAIQLPKIRLDGLDWQVEHRLLRCAGCGAGALARLAIFGNQYPHGRLRLLDFYRETSEALPLPQGVPEGIRTEFEEAESCMAAGALRAAAGLFRSVLDKTMRANGYKLKPGTTLEQQIDLAGADGVITAARLRRTHDEVRVLGNDVLHDEWRPIPREDVEAAHHYAQRILEDFYDERNSVLRVLREKGRIPIEDVPEAGAGA